MLTIGHGRRRAPKQGLVELLMECHGRIRGFVELARVAASGEAPAGQVAAACRDVARYFRQALPLHVADEEESLLPRLRGRSPEVDAALEAMAAQHAAHGAGLAELLEALARLEASPADAHARARLARASDALAVAFEAHLRLEEAAIFPAIRRELSPAVEAEIVAEVRARRRP